MTTSDTSMRVDRPALPDGWQWVTLGEVGTFIYGAALPERVRQAGDAPVFGSNGIVGSHNVALTEGATIIIGRKGSIGQVHFSPVPCWPIDTTYYIEQARISVNIEWLYFLLRNLNLSRLNKSSAVPGLNREDAHKQLIPLPPIAEQRRIVAYLHAQIATIRKMQAMVQAQWAAAQDMSAALLHSIFAGEEAAAWERKPLGEVCDVKSGSTPSTADPAHWNGHIVWITPTDLGQLSGTYIYTSARLITEQGQRQAGLELIEPESVILSSRAPIGHLGITKVPLCINQGCKSFTPYPGVLAEYLYFALRFSVPELQSIGTGATFKEVSKTTVENFPIPLPPIVEQQRIVARLEAQLAAAADLQRELAARSQKLELLPATLIGQAMRGELRLPATEEDDDRIA